MNIEAYHMSKKKPEPKASRERRLRQKKIGDQLRQLYDEVASEPVPDDFMKLLEQADQSKSKG